MSILRACWHFLPDFLREPDRTWHEQPMVDCERQALVLAKERDSERDYKGSEPFHHVQIRRSTSDVQQHLHSLQSLGRNYGALRPLDENLQPHETRARKV